MKKRQSKERENCRNYIPWRQDWLPFPSWGRSGYSYVAGLPDFELSNSDPPRYRLSAAPDQRIQKQFGYFWNLSLASDLIIFHLYSGVYLWKIILKKTRKLLITLRRQYTLLLDPSDSLSRVCPVIIKECFFQNIFFVCFSSQWKAPFLKKMLGNYITPVPCLGLTELYW